MQVAGIQVIGLGFHITSTNKTLGKPVSFNATRIRFAWMLTFWGFVLVSDAKSMESPIVYLLAICRSAAQ